MQNKLLNLNEIRDDGRDVTLSRKVEKTSKADIAIIGMSGKFPLAPNIAEFWENLRHEKDCIRAFPEKRLKDALPLLPNGFMPEDPPSLCEAGYLEDIDKFDYEFFNLSPNEARLMDPNQRVFLETAWSVIEDAGYGSSRIKGSKTGVYIGHSSDMKYEYHMYVNAADPGIYRDISVPGNVKSIIASRISYILDLKGPSVAVDTACSSALTAVHLACKGIINGDCDMAVAGGVKINIMPIKKSVDEDIGIGSPGDRARTFDDSSDGTSMGEGVAAILLKPLKKAVSDGDNIYAVIKGSAINQDGNSIGLTAPNSAAQEEVILEAWKNAGIDPETISYIEAHGTATRLGDPIEISGIERAFQKHTDRKNFCAVGSVKTNIGHLDNLAGMAGLFKLVLALKHREIPANIHFKRPNRKINFINSPVYINDRLTKWETDGFPLRGGVSSFGLAGTNCHVVIEEYRHVEKKPEEEVQQEVQVFTLSARNREALTRLVNDYKKYLAWNEEVLLQDICHSANSGRMHYNHRLAIMINSRAELIERLNGFGYNPDRGKGVYYKEFKIVSGNKELRHNEISEEAARESGRLANELIKGYQSAGGGLEAVLDKVCRLYTEGAEIDWDLLYKGGRKKVSLPTYPFKRSRCWVEPKLQKTGLQAVKDKEFEHPLLDRCVIKSPGQEIYAANFNTVDNWVIGEHKVTGKCVMPGTAYLEMIRQIYSKHLIYSYLELEDVLFLSPFVLNEGENKEIQIILSEKDNCCDVLIASESQAGHGWNRHLEGRVRTVRKDNVPVLCVNDIIYSSNMKEIPDDKKVFVDTGPRWTEIRKKMYAGSNGEYLAFFELPEAYADDLARLYLHPSLMDRSVNAANSLIGEGSYLPLSYRNIIVYGTTPERFYSYLKRKDLEKNSNETVRFDIFLIREDGRVFVEVKDYVIKRVREDEFKYRQLKENRNIFHEIGWKLEMSKENEMEMPEGETLIFLPEDKFSHELVEKLRAAGVSLIEVEMGEVFSEVNKNRYVINGEEDGYQSLLERLRGRKLSRIIHLAALSHGGRAESTAELLRLQKSGVCSLFHLTRALISNKFNNEIDIVLVARYANEVTKSEKTINPHSASMFGLGKVVRQEYTNLKCRCIDIDDDTPPESVIQELRHGGNSYQAAYRGTKRYIDEFKKLNLSKIHSHKLDIKENGLYIITGGMGGLGLEVGKYLASRSRVKLVLINRTKLPSREEWEGVLESGLDNKLIRAIRAIREMEKGGSEVLCFSADVSEFDAMKVIIEELRGKFGPINGIVHCAGVAGDGFIIRKEEENFNNVLAPKIQGTWNLDRVTENDNPDFFVMFSSITSIMGGQGQGDYTAANAYMDSFAAFRSKQGKRTLSINWPSWSETGMAVDYGVDDSGNTLKGITTETAIFSLQEVLGKQTHRVIIGELNYGVVAGLKDMLPLSLADETQLMINEYDSSIKTIQASDVEASQCIMVTGGEDEPAFSTTELKVAAIWGEILGLEEVNIFDRFGEVGGDSILATRLLRKLENEYPGMIDIADVFAYDTVNEMAAYLEGRMNKMTAEETAGIQNEEDELDKLLSKLAKGEISVSDAEKYY